MSKLDKDKAKDTVNILMQLNEKNLLLISGGAQMLLAKQEADKKKEKAGV